MRGGMDWRSVTFDWNRARAFLVTAEEGSLSAAARALGMTQPTLGRQVAALEEELGVTLFERAGRGLILTDSGARLVAHVRAMGEAASAVSLAASGQATDIAGPVAITASEIYCGWLLPPILARLRDVAPGVRVEIVASNALSDLKRREADIALRNVRPDQADLIGKHIAEDSAGFFASPEYIARDGPFETVADLARAQFLGFENTTEFVAVLEKHGVPVSEAQFAISASTHPLLWDFARAGLGIGTGPVRMGESDPGLRRVVPDVRFTFPVWLVAHRELRTSPRVRLVWDLLAEMVPAALKG